MLNTENLMFWENTNTDAALNLAIEESLLNSFTKEDLDPRQEQGKGIFMLWHNAPSVIIGRHQNAFEEVDMPYLEEHSIDLVRRSSGGGAVYHDLGNLNFSFIIPTKSPKVDFHTFLNPMVEVLSSLGIPASLSGRNDILADGRKISGSAQAKGKYALLVHGTLLVSVDMEVLAHVLSGNPDKYTSKGIASIRSRVANINEFLSNNIEQRSEDMQKVKDTLKNFFCPKTNIDASGYLPQDKINTILETAHTLAKTRYANSDWTLMQHPPFTSTARVKFSFGAVRVSYNVHKGFISECKIEGDFFALQDLNLIEQALIQVKYEQSNIEHALEDIDFADFILNAPAKGQDERIELIRLFSAC